MPIWHALSHPLPTRDQHHHFRGKKIDPQKDENRTFYEIRLRQRAKKAARPEIRTRDGRANPDSHPRPTRESPMRRPTRRVDAVVRHPLPATIPARRTEVSPERAPSAPEF